MDELKKSRIHQFEIIGAIVLLLIAVASFFPKAGITGFVSVETKKQKIDLAIANSQSYILTTNSLQPFYITNLKLSGDVEGEGIAKVYLMNQQGQKILIFSNVIKKNEGLGDITGMSKITGNAVGTGSVGVSEDLVIEHLEDIQGDFGTLAQDETLVSGNFDSVCIDSCFIEIPLEKGTAYQLMFYVQEGVILKVNEIVYTTKKD